MVDDGGMRARRSLVSLAFVALAACSRGDPFVGEKPPPLDSSTGTWLGVDAPLEWKGLIGNVVLLEFGFLR